MSDNLDSPSTVAPRGHETTDISIRGVTWFLIGLGIVLALTGLGLWWFFDQLESYARQGDPPPSPVARNEAPPAPQLQVSARGDLQELRQAERERLGGYGWVDEKNGIVHIPIEEAIDRVALDEEQSRRCAPRKRFAAFPT